MSSAVQSAFARRRQAASAAAGGGGGGGTEVDEVDEELRADRADEALWMPVTVCASA